MARRRMLIYRDYREYSGGHGKFLDYVAHIDAHPDWQAEVYLTPDSIRHDNPFADLPNRIADWRPDACDALLLGGMDWTAVPAPGNPNQPVVNLLQHVRHADADLPLRAFLSRRAIRIGNSSLVTEAVRATGEVNGPLVTIPSGLDLAQLRRVGSQPITTDVFVDGVKQRALGEAVAAALRTRGLRVHLQAERIPLAEYLQAMAAAVIAVPLPHATEGLYLPGLNAMAMGRALVQPDCIGSREYAIDGTNALVPAREAASIADAVCRLHGDHDLRRRLVDAARAAVIRFDLATERQQFHKLLDRIDHLWTC